jgi:hypothetical protein
MATTTADKTISLSEPKRLWGVLAEFEDVDHLLLAAERVRDAGFRRWDCYTPFPVHHLDDAMGQKPTILPWIVLVCGLTGLLTGVLLQWWTNASFVEAAPTFLQGYPYIISGKPIFSLPANIPVIFELTILFSALGAVVGMLALNNLPVLYHPLFKKPRFNRVTDDRFFIAIEAMDEKFEAEETKALLASLGATVVEDVEE